MITKFLGCLQKTIAIIQNIHLYSVHDIRLMGNVMSQFGKNQMNAQIWIMLRNEPATFSAYSH